jgi:hypothetical protein
VPVPGETLDADLRDVAAEAAVAVDQGRTRAGACGSKRRGETARAATDHKHVRFQDDVDRSGCFRNFFHFREIPWRSGQHLPNQYSTWRRFASLPK